MSNHKTLARKRVVQALYQWQMTRYPLTEIERQFLEEHGLGKGEITYFSHLLHAVPAALDEVDAAISEFTSRPIEQIDPVERAILRLSTFELLHQPELPYRVIVNEGVNLAKEFGASESFKFVNGLLDRLAKKLRLHEYKALGKER